MSMTSLHPKRDLTLWTLRGQVFEKAIPRLIYDGDSMTLEFDLGPEWVTETGRHRAFKCRIAGLDTPEIRSRNPLERRAGKAARGAVGLLLFGKHCAFREGHPWNKPRIIHETPLRVAVDGEDKYGRELVHVFLSGDTTLAEELIVRGFAKPYTGGTKEPWTEEEWMDVCERYNELLRCYADPFPSYEK